MSRVAVLALTLAASASAPAAPLEITTRGQAQLVARRHAIDEAAASLTDEAEALLLRGELTLGEWMDEHPDEAPDVRQRLHEGEFVRDEPEGGRWHVATEITVHALRDVLAGSVRDAFADEPDRRLTGRGSAAIPWTGANIDDPVSRASATPPREQESNLPPIPESFPPTPGSEGVVPSLRPALAEVGWADRVTLDATGSGSRSDEAAAEARRALITALRALPIGATATVGDWVDASPTNRSLFEAHLGRAVESARRLTPDGEAEVDLVIPLRGLRRAIEESQP